MAINSIDQLAGARKDQLSIAKLASFTTILGQWFTTWDVVGNPGAGTLAGASKTVAVKPDDSTPGAPLIPDYAAGALGYLAQVDFGTTVACRMKLFDMLWKAGAYAYNDTTAVTVTTSPDFSGRLPVVNGQPSWQDTQLWMEVSTAFVTGTSWNISVSYTNQAGTAGRTALLPTGLAASALIGRRMVQIPLQAGDTGIRSIQSVTANNGGTAMTAGAVNVLILRPLWSGRCRITNDGDVHGWDKTGLPQVPQDACIFAAVNADSTASGIPEFELVVASG